MAVKPRRVAPDRWAGWAIGVAVVSLVAFLPDGFARWFLPKEVVLLAAVVLASLALPAGRLPRFLWWLIAAGATILVASALLGDAPLAQLLGRWPRYEGLVSLPVYVAAAWLGARILGPSAPVDRLRTFYRSLGLVSVLIAAVGVAEAFGARPIASDLERPGSLLGNATDQGLVGAAIAALLVLPLVRAIEGRDRAAVRATASQWVPLAVGLVAAVASVALSASRAAALALGAALVVLAVGYLVEAGGRLHWRGVARRVLAVVLAATAVAGALLALPFTRDRLLGSSGLSTSTVGDRFVIWGESIALLAGAPLTGVGPSGYLDAVVTQHGPRWYERVGAGTVLDSPHAWPLQAAMAGGIPLLAVALVFCGYLLFRVRRARPTTGGDRPPRRADARRDLVVGAFAALVGLAAGLATHFTAPTTGILIGLLVGVVVAVAPTADRRGWRSARTALFAVWLVLLAVATGAEVPLQRAMTAPDAREAQELFAQASGLRPWDADLASIAAQSLAARADSGDPAAAAFAVTWAERSLAGVPSSVATQTALAVAQRSAGDAVASAGTLGELADRVPLDATIAFQHGLSLAAAGDLAAAERELERAASLRPDDDAVLSALERVRAAR